MPSRCWRAARADAAAASAVALAHNHPSGSPESSRADEFLTQNIKSALALVDVRILDQFVVAGDQLCSVRGTRTDVTRGSSRH